MRRPLVDGLAGGLEPVIGELGQRSQVTPERAVGASAIQPSAYLAPYRRHDRACASWVTRREVACASVDGSRRSARRSAALLARWRSIVPPVLDSRDVLGLNGA